MERINTQRGFSIVDVIMGIGIVSVVFMALFASFQAMLQFAERNRLHANAVLLANEHVEVIRALPYDSIGTVSGLPPGSIPQTETITHDGREYTRRTFIQYVDDPADGLGAADTLAADYKRAKIELSYDHNGTTQSFSLITTIAPRSQESLVGAGILRINVTDAVNNPLGSASVHVLNTTVATSVDITTFTNASGTVSLPGAWAGSGYEITISKTGYSGAQTYTATTSNPNPSPSPATVAENSTTEIYFKIDKLSTIHLFTRAWPVRGRLLDSFPDSSQLAVMQNTQVLGDALTLAGVPGTYVASGTSASIPVTPGSLGEWLLLSFDDTLPANTNATYVVEYDTGGSLFAPVSPGDLPGNDVGFTASPVNLSGLSTSTYDSLRITSDLTSTDPNVTPQVLEWKLSYHEVPVPEGTVDFTLRGSKTIGTDGGGDPIYKYDQSHQTGGTGSWQSGDMEWDEYELSVTGYTVAEACPTPPLTLEPDTNFSQALTLESITAHSLRLQVTGSLGDVVPHAEVQVVGGATDTTRSTGPCGIAYFPSLAIDTYTVSVTAAGLTATTTSVSVSGETDASITLEL